MLKEEPQCFAVAGSITRTSSSGWHGGHVFLPDGTRRDEFVLDRKKNGQPTTALAAPSTCQEKRFCFSFLAGVQEQG